MQKSNEKAKPKIPQLVPGMRDILPSEQELWQCVRKRIELFAEQYGFERLDTPVLEEVALYASLVGKMTNGEASPLISMEDTDGKRVSLRYGWTPAAMRAYFEHGFETGQQPVRVFSYGPFFHTAGAKGDRRQVHEFGFAVIGDTSPVVDALLIQLVYHFYADMDLPINIEINSVGHALCRESYKRVLVDYYKTRKNALCEECKRHLVKSPMRLLECQQPDCQTLLLDAPQIVDHLCDECRNHFVSVLEYLDGGDIPYSLNPRTIRRPDVYTKTTFNVHLAQSDAAPVGLGVGGRHDGFAESLGFAATPACGFVGSMERFVQKINELHLRLPPVKKPDVFIAQLGENARKKSLQLFEGLRRAGIGTSEAFSKDGLVQQMALAAKLGVPFSLIIGQKEMMDNTIIIRDMENGIQEIVDYQKVIPEIQKRLVKRNGTANNNQST